MFSMPALSHQEIKNFPFVHKVWIVVHVQYCEFLRWNQSGDCIVIDIAGLELYLNSSRNIFHFRSTPPFLQQLEAFGFERYIARDPSTKEFSLLYYHKDFQQYRFDAVATIRKTIAINPVLMAAGGAAKTPPNLVVEQLVKELRRSRMPGDLCFTAYENISPLIRQRMYASLVMDFQRQTQKLTEKLVQVPVVQRTRRKCDAPVINGVLCDGSGNEDAALLMETYENPLTSTFYMNCSSTDCAGFYGDAKKNHLQLFFGDYMPHYVNGKVEVMKSNHPRLDEEPEETDSPTVEYFPDDNDANGQWADNDNTAQSLVVEESANLDAMEFQSESAAEVAADFEMIMHDEDESTEPQLADEPTAAERSTMEDEGGFYTQLRESFNVLYDNENGDQQ